MVIPRRNQHLVFLHVLSVKLTLLQVRASRFMLGLSSPPAQSLGKGLSSVQTAVIRRMPWKENVQVESEWHNSLLSHSLIHSFLFFIFGKRHLPRAGSCLHHSTVARQMYM
jgi:hypothetical protein